MPHPSLPGLNLTFPVFPDLSQPALLERKVFGVEGGSTFLECEPRSLQAHVEWTFQRSGEGTSTPVSLGGRESWGGGPDQALVLSPTAVTNEALACSHN